MLKSLVVLAIFSTMSAPALAQPAPVPQGTAAAPQPKPQTVKKRVCEEIDEDSYSRLGKRKICRTIEVKVEAPSGGSNPQTAPAPAHSGHSH